MTTDELRIERCFIHGQEVFLPSPETWRALAGENPILNGMALPTLGWVHSWLSEHAHNGPVYLGLVVVHQRWLSLPLLHAQGSWFRVHFENVVCEHCSRSCGLSATPDIPSYAGTGYTIDQVWEEFRILGVRACPHCNGRLERRQTAWLASEDSTS